MNIINLKEMALMQEITTLTQEPKNELSVCELVKDPALAGTARVPDELAGGGQFLTG